MTQTLRIFLKPAGEQHVDVTVPDEVDGNAIVASMKMDGYIAAQRVVIPVSSVHLILFMNNTEQKTTLTIFPGGRDPNTPLVS